MVNNTDSLEDRIQQLKNELILKIERTGLNSHDTLCYSQQLVKLITIYQRYLRHSNEPLMTKITSVLG
jgi:stage 0 sporulation regulatory protein